MTEKLFDILTKDELDLVKAEKQDQGELRNVRVGELTLNDLLLLGRVIWPTAPKGSIDIYTVLDTLKIRKAL